MATDDDALVQASDRRTRVRRMLHALADAAGEAVPGTIKALWRGTKAVGKLSNYANLAAEIESLTPEQVLDLRELSEATTDLAETGWEHARSIAELRSEFIETNQEADDRGALDCLMDWKPLDCSSQQPGQLLRARYEVVPFDSTLRRPELEQLRAFSSASSLGVLIVTGDGGSGKTRLLLEWCRRMRDDHWLAGFVDMRVADLRPATRGKTPRLLVIDYAETQTERVVGLIQSMLRSRDQTKIRLVLLARRHGPWVDVLRDEDGIAELIDQWPELKLAVLDDAQRHATYRAAYLAFAGKEADSSFEVDEEDDRPLFAHMRALLAWLDGPNASLSRDKVLERIVGHERKFWARQLEEFLGRTPGWLLLHDADRLGTALVLVDGLETAAKLPDLARRGFGNRKTEFEALSDCFYSLYSDGTRVMGLEPDLLGEHLVFTTLARDEKKRGTEAISRWLDLPFEPEFTGAIGRTLTVLTRVCSYRQDARSRGWLSELLRRRGAQLVGAIAVAQTETDPPVTIFADAIVATNDVGLAEFLDSMLPKQTVQLREVTVAVALTIVAARRCEGKDEHAKGRLAGSLAILGVRLSLLGRREKALEATSEAVELFRKLADAQPDVFLRDLASSLNNLGGDLSLLGRREEALAASLEAVAIRRKLADARPDAFLRNLAGSLVNLSTMLGGLRRREEALEASRDAVKSYRKLADSAPDAFISGEFAISLNNLGNRLSDLGKWSEALEATREAVAIQRELTHASPDAFLPDLAASLNDLGNRLSDLGKRGEALEAACEAAAIQRKLASARPDVFLPDLAMYLNNLGTRLGDLGRREEAFEATSESVELYRGQVDSRADAFLPNLATSLNNLGTRLRDLGRREEAFEATSEAVAIRRKLADARPDVFLPDLAMSLNNIGNRLRELGRREEAFKATREAVVIRRLLAETQPDTLLPDLAMSLSNLGTMLPEFGTLEEAFEVTHEALVIRRKLADTRGDAFLPDLATSLNNLGAMLNMLERREDALEAMREAVVIRRNLADTFLPDLAMSLDNLGAMLNDLGEWKEALEASREAVESYRKLAEAGPDTFLPDLAFSLHRHGVVLYSAGRLRAASLSFAEGLRAAHIVHLTRPAAVAHLIRTLAYIYQRASNDSSTEIAEDLAPFLASLDLADPNSST